MTPTATPPLRGQCQSRLPSVYDQRRAAGDLHHQALRALGNRLVGILHGCLRHHTRYNEHIAWAHRNQDQQEA